MVLAALLDGHEVKDGWPLDDRGLAYGDGLFETISIEAGRPRLLSFHRERLLEGCRRLGVQAPPETLWEDVCKLAKTPACGVVKVIATRSGGRGYRPASRAALRHLVMALPAPDYPASWARDGVKVRLCDTRLGAQPLLAGLKHLNRLEQVLARSEWDQPTIVEGLMLNQQGHMVEATQSNVFMVRDGIVQTPALDQCGVAGVMRRLVLDVLAPQLGLQCRIGCYRVNDLLASDEIFLTGSIIGILPVTAVGCWRPSGEHRITRMLQQRLATVVL